MKRIIFFLLPCIIMYVSGTTCMDRELEISDEETFDQDVSAQPQEALRLQLLIQAEVAKQLKVQSQSNVTSEKRTPPRGSSLKQLGAQIIDYAGKHPIAVGASVAALIAIPATIYWYTRPTFSFNDQKYQSFYKTTLTANQRQLYNYRLLNVHNPLDLVDYKALIESLMIDQKIELLFLFRNYIEEHVALQAQSEKAQLEPEEVKSGREDDLKLSTYRCQAFEKMVFNELTLPPQPPVLIESYNAYYAEKGLPVRCCNNTFVFDRPPQLLCLSKHQKCAAVGENNVITVWDTITGKCISLINSRLSAEIYLLMIDPPGKSIVAVSTVGEISILSIEKQAVISRWTYKNEGRITALTFNKTGSLLATGTAQGIIKVWDTSTGTLVRGLQLNQKSPISQMSIPAADVMFVLAQGRALVWMWDSQNSIVRENAAKISTLTANAQAAVAYDTEWLICEQGEIKLYDYKSGSFKTTFNLGSQPLTLYGADDALHFALVRPKGIIEIWDRIRGELVCTFKGLSEQLHLAFGLSSSDIMGVCSHKDGTILRNWEWNQQEADLDNPVPDEWMPLFGYLGSQIHPMLSNEELQEAWLPYCVDDPHVLLEKSDFISMLTSADLKNRYLTILRKFTDDFYNTSLSTILPEDPKEYRKIIGNTGTVPGYIIRAGELTQEQRTALTNLNLKMDEYRFKQKLFESTIK